MASSLGLHGQDPNAKLPGLPDQQTPSVRAVRIVQSLVLDGRLDEDAWKQAPVASGLTQWGPNYGEPSNLTAEVKFLCDDSYIYVGAWMPAAPGTGPVVGHLHRRDQWSASDWFWVVFDTQHDHWNAFAFYVNAANVQQDQLRMGPVVESAWDAVWESAVHVQEGGWSAELKIPFSILRAQKGGGSQTWGLQFGRENPGLAEVAAWRVPPREVSNITSVFGHLEGLEGIPAKTGFEWLPFLSAQRKFETSEDWDDRRWKGRAGLDAKASFASAGELNLAVRPDFGQVEVDQAVLNLSTVETLFPEKRPFFTQGMEVFSHPYGHPFFYTRRIGQGLAAPALNAGERIVERPLAAELLGALKYTGRFGGGRTLGVLGASTEAAKARIADASGHEREELLAPQSTFGVFNFVQPIGNNGNRIYSLFTYMNQNGRTGREALLGAIGGTFQTLSKRLTLDLVLDGTRAGVKGGQVSGWQEGLQLQAGLGHGISMSSQSWYVTRKYDPNDVGYLGRSDQRGGNLILQKNWDQARGGLRNRELIFSYWRIEDQTGQTFDTGLGAKYSLQFANQWILRLRGRRYMALEDDLELRTFRDERKKYLHVEPWSWYAVEFAAPGRWPWSFSGSFGVDRFGTGPLYTSSLTQTIRPSTNWEIGLETSFTEERGNRKYVATAPVSQAPFQGQSPGIPIVGLRRLSQFGQVIRVSYTFSTRLSAQVFLQGLAASWAFRELEHYLDDRTLAPGLPAGAAQPRTSFASRLFNANAILRWEFKPGSTAYLVYTHGVSDGSAINGEGSLRPLADLAALRRFPSDDVVQLKLSWLFR